MTTFVSWFSITLWALVWLGQVAAECPSGAVGIGLVGKGIYCVSGQKWSSK